MSCVDGRMNGREYIGTWLARYFGLDSRYFAKMNTRRNTTVYEGVETKKIDRVVIVYMPCHIAHYISQGFVACRVEDGDDIDFEYVFPLTKDTRIGFWK